MVLLSGACTGSCARGRQLGTQGCPRKAATLAVAFRPPSRMHLLSVATCSFEALLSALFCQSKETNLEHKNTAK